jgi:2-dehydropantoate 2-reductase
VAIRRALIAGAGALGSVFGAMLSRGGADVTLLGRPEHMRAVARDGLRVTGLFGEHVATRLGTIDDAAKLAGEFDLILFSVKSYDTESMARALDGRLARDGIIVSMQNGLGNIETLIARFGAARTLGARVIFGAELTRPGVARVTVFAEAVAVGPAPKLHRADAHRLGAPARAIADLLNNAGIPTVAVADVLPILWTKVLYNVALNPLGALLGLHYGALADDPALRDVMDRAIDEAFAVARADGVELPFVDAADYRRVFYERLLPTTYDHRPSMLYDLRERGRTEIDALNGKVVELAERYAIATPTNRVLCALIRASERRRRPPLEPR